MRYIHLIILACLIFISNLAIGATQTERDSLISILNKEIPDSVRINTLYELSSSDITKDKDQCIFWLHEALTLAQNNDFKNKEAKIKQSVGIIYVQSFDSIRGLNYLNQANNYYKNSGTLEQRINSLKVLGGAYKTFSRHKRSIAYYKEALNLSDTEESKAKCLNLIGLDFIHLCDYEEALNNLFEAEKIIEKTDDKLSLAQIKTNIGVIYMRLKDFDKALGYFTISAEFKKELGDIKGLVVSYSNIGSILHFQGKSDESISIFKKALALAREIDNKVMIIPILGNIGSILNDKKDYPNAIKYLKEAIDINLAQNNPQLYSNLGKAYYNTDKTSLALGYFKQGFEIAKRNSQLEFVKTISGQLCNYYRDRKEFQKAFEYADVFLATKDSLLNEKMLSRINEMQTKHDAERHASKLLLLEKNNELKLSQKNNLIYILIIASILFFSILILVVKRYKFLKQWSSDMLFQKEKVFEEESSRLKHDCEKIEKQLNSRNSELSSHIMHVSEKNEFISRITNRLMILKKTSKKENQRELDLIISELKRNTQDDIWNEFDIRFNKIQKDFYDRLNASFPNLSTSERRLCAFLRMNMTSKEISQITYQSPRGIDTARSRLRKKLLITDSNTNLTSFLINL